MSTHTVPALPNEVCAADNDHDLPAEVIIYDSNAPLWVPRSELRVVCNDTCEQALTDSYPET